MVVAVAAAAVVAVEADFEPMALQGAEPEPVKWAGPQSKAVSGQPHCSRRPSSSA